MEYVYTPEGVCPMAITVDLDGDRINRVEFLGGCNGNLKAISKVVSGMTADEAIETFTGITCGEKNTSCTDQMARAIRAAREKQA